jgi:hypothetical protein
MLRCPRGMAPRFAADRVGVAESPAEACMNHAPVRSVRDPRDDAFDGAAPGRLVFATP